MAGVEVLPDSEIEEMCVANYHCKFFAVPSSFSPPARAILIYLYGRAEQVMEEMGEGQTFISYQNFESLIQRSAGFLQHFRIRI